MLFFFLPPILSLYTTSASFKLMIQWLFFTFADLIHWIIRYFFHRIPLRFARLSKTSIYSEIVSLQALLFCDKSSCKLKCIYNQNNLVTNMGLVSTYLVSHSNVCVWRCSPTQNSIIITRNIDYYPCSHFVFFYTNRSLFLCLPWTPQ